MDPVVTSRPIRICIISGVDPANQIGEAKNIQYFARHINEPILVLFPGAESRSWKLGLQAIVEEIPAHNIVIDNVQREDARGVSLRLVPALARKYLEFFVRSIPRIVRFKPDVIHLRLPGAILLGIFAKVFLRSKVVLTYHGPNIQKIIQWPWQRALLRWADLVYYHSRLMKDQLLRIYPESKLVFAGPGVDLDQFRPLGWQRKKQILAVGHIRWYKGYEYLIEALAEVLKKYPDYSLLIAGSGPLEAEARQKIAALGLDGKVQLLGVQPTEKVVELLNESQLFVMASVAEGSPKAQIEAIACGTPSVVTSVCHCGDAASEVGLVVEPRDSAALAVAIQTLIDNAALWEQCAENCKVVAKQFDWNVLTRDLHQSYLKLLAGNASLPPHAGPTASSRTFAQDGAWCWISDPRAICRDGKTYAGWITSDGSVQVGVLDHRSGAIHIETLHEGFERDDHDNPALLFLPDGRLMAFYSRHGKGDMHLRVTTRPGDVGAWSTHRPLGLMRGQKSCRGVTYQNPALLSDEANALYLFYRGTDWKPAFSVSRDHGQTWTQPRTLVKRQTRTKRNRPYLKAWSDSKGRIDLVFTDGHPRREPTNSVYFLRYQEGSFWKADGTRLGSFDDLPLDPSAADRVYDGWTAGRAWIWDIAEDRTGQPVILYTRLPGKRKHQYHYARWDGETWMDHDICAAGKWFPHTRLLCREREPHYSGGIALDHGDPSVVYLSRPVDGVFEIERWTTPDGGATWRSEAITRRSKHDNVRPFVVRDHNANGPTVLWMELRRYAHYTDFDAAIKMAS
jgi:glycosyltransferase involved in cell wall biosynthesis